MNGHEKAVLVGLDAGGGSDGTNKCKNESEKSLDELEELALTAGLEVCAKVLQRRPAKDPSSLIGRGKLAEIGAMCHDMGAGVIVFDDELSGVQIRNIEEATEARVIDRTALILDIFAQRAHSNEGKLQVELAQLKYRLPRLTGFGGQLSRLGGGIGTRGPGEKKLETDRRHIRRRIGNLEDALKLVGRRRRITREGRKQKALPVIALVGYTNTGKSTLMNALCGSSSFTEDKLFATLDPTVRRLLLPDGRHALLVDTVGFISKLPHDLIDAFKSTLEEVSYADLLLHVADASDPEAVGRIPVVESILAGLGAAGKETIIVFNKIDAVDGNYDIPPEVGHSSQKSVAVSALNGKGLDRLLDAMAAALPPPAVEIEIFVPYGEGWALSYIHENGRIITEEFTEGGISIKAALPGKKLRKLSHLRVSG